MSLKLLMLEQKFTAVELRLSTVIRGRQTYEYSAKMHSYVILW